MKILRAGWTDHIPLDAVTNKACRVASAAVTRSSESAFTMGAGGNLVVRSATLDCSKEDKITMLEYAQASRNFVFAIGRYLHAAGDDYPGGPNAKTIAKVFRVHFFNISSRPDFEELYPVYLEYCMLIR